MRVVIMVNIINRMTILIYFIELKMEILSCKNYFLIQS